MLCFTLKIWEFTSEWHPLFQITNSSPVLYLLLSNLYTVALGQNFPLVVMFSSSDSAEIEKWIEKPPIAINQMVFFLSLDDMQVFETYQVT